MRVYKCLTNSEFTSDNFKLIPIRFEDRWEILKMRNEQIYHLRQSELLTEDMQDLYFKNIISKLFESDKPNQLLFSLIDNQEFVGYGGLVHINWIDKNAEVSFIMKTEYEKERFNFYWSNFLHILEVIAFKELAFRKIFTFAFDLRPQLYPILESAGFCFEARLKDHCLFNGKYFDVVINSKLNTDA